MAARSGGCHHYDSRLQRKEHVSPEAGPGPLSRGQAGVQTDTVPLQNHFSPTPCHVAAPGSSQFEGGVYSHRPSRGKEDRPQPGPPCRSWLSRSRRVSRQSPFQGPQGVPVRGQRRAPLVQTSPCWAAFTALSGQLVNTRTLRNKLR